MPVRACRVFVAIVMGSFGLLLALSPSEAAAKKKEVPTTSFTGQLMKYTAKGDAITQIYVIQPTPTGKTLQKVHNLNVNKKTLFIVKDGDEKTELDSTTVLTDDKTKELFTLKAGGTLNNTDGIRVTIAMKGSAVTSVTITQKKKN